MKKKKFPLPLLFGSILILFSLCAMAAFQLWIYVGSARSQQVVAQINQVLPPKTNGIPGVYSDMLMPVLEVSGQDYVGLLDIPAFGITLPVSDSWNNRSLSTSPARYWGSVYDHSLVIGGADYPKQFGFCDEIDNGATITFTDMTGARFIYTVTRVDRAKHANNQWLFDEEFDLTLFCKGTYSTDYIAVRCNFSNK